MLTSLLTVAVDQYACHQAVGGLLETAASLPEKRVSYFPIEWPRLIPASELRSGSFGYLADRAHVGVLVGTADDNDVAVFLRSDAAGYGVSLCSELEGAAHRLVDFAYEIDPSSGEPLELAPSPIGSLIIKGDRLWIAARPKLGHTSRSTLKIGYAPVELSKIDRSSESDVAFAYARWRIVKHDREFKHVLHERAQPQVEG